LNFTDVDGADKEEKQPNQSAGKKAEEKTAEKVAFICVGDIEVETGIPIVGGIVDWLGQQATNIGVARDIRRLRREFEQAGYKVIVDEECTEEDIEKALRNPNVKAFAFIGHSAATNDLVVPAGGRIFQCSGCGEIPGGTKVRTGGDAHLFFISTESRWYNSFQRGDDGFGRSIRR